LRVIIAGILSLDKARKCIVNWKGLSLHAFRTVWKSFYFARVAAKTGPDVSTTTQDLSPAAQFVQELIRIPTDPLRKEFIAGHQQLFHPEYVEKLTEAVHAQVRINADLALSLAESALAIAQAIGHAESVGRSLRAKANALYALGKNAEAIQFYEQARQAFEAQGNDLELAITLSSCIQAHILVGEYEPALESAERARTIFIARGEKRRLARLDINVGNILHRQDRFEEALACYERSYEIVDSLGDNEAIAAVLSNLAVALIALNDFPRALETYQKARDFCKRNGMTVLTGQADYNIAWLYYLRGEYSTAIQMLLSNREECRANGDVYQFALDHLDLSEVYLELNLSGEAAETAHEGRRLFQKNGNGYEENKCLANEAIALSQQGKAFRAIELFAEARNNFVAEKNAVWPWLIDLYQALVLLEEGRLFEARSLCQRARTFFATSPLPGKAVLCDLLLARISLSDGDIRSAERECRRALDLLQALKAPALRYQAEALMGKIQRALNDRGAAYASLQEAREALTSLRSNLRDEELKIPFFKNKLEVYEGLVEICLERDSTPAGLEEAFTYIEEAKSRTLADLLLRGGPSPAPSEGGKSELVRQIRNLREELNWYYHRIDIEQLQAEEKSSERVKKLEEQAEAREAEFLRALREMQATGEITADVSQILPLAAIRACLPENATMLEYFTIGDHVIACVIGKESLEIAAITLNSRVVQLVRLLQSQISMFGIKTENARNLEASPRDAITSHLGELYEELISPIRSSLSGSSLVIVPHGSLHYVPFQALHDGSSYLIDTFTISYAPSASIFALCQRKPPHPGGNSLVLGVPGEDAPAILNEVQAAAAAMPSSSLFLGKEATLARLKQAGPRSRFLHIAAQGEFRQDNPLFSGIRLGDARLNLYDLYQLQLPAELVALTGCATGTNAVAAGDELLGLTRGFFHAGTHALLLAQWNVHGPSSAEFMTAFYRNLNAGQRKPLALQRAMIEVRDRHNHPYYWAPFFLAGKAS
jgi:CHAT domain-containing protein